MEKSSTSKGQKIAIWIILVAMAVGSLGAYFVILLANSNQKDDQAQATKQLKQQQDKQAAIKKEPLKGYKATPFDKAKVTKLKVETLKKGSGKAASKSSTVTANYFGWTSKGKIFDSTNRDGKTAPIPFSLNGVIPGWTEGLDGVKAGSTIKLTIPSDKAYGPSGSQDGSIKPNEPLTFIIEVKKVK